LLLTPETEFANDKWWKQIEKDKLHVRILSGISFEGNAESMVGKGTLYAVPKWHHNNNLPRYDFITVLSQDGVDLAQV
jgi:hypothetical protein